MVSGKGFSKGLLTVDREPTPAILTPRFPDVGCDGLEGDSIEETLNRSTKLRFLDSELRDDLGIDRTGDLRNTMIIHRNHGNVSCTFEQLGKGLPPNKRVIDRDYEDVVAIGPVQRSCDPRERTMCVNRIWPGLPTFAIGSEKNDPIQDGPQCSSHHFEHGPVRDQDVCLVLSHPGAHSAVENCGEGVHMPRLFVCDGLENVEA